jgi:hypothetical protein
MAIFILTPTGLYGKLVYMSFQLKPGGHAEWYKRYDNIDGTAEMFMGLMLLGFGLLGYLHAALPKESRWRTSLFGNLLLMYGTLAVVMALGYGVRSIIKRKLTFPRTGYVAGHSLWHLLFARRPAGAEAVPGVPTRKGAWLVLLPIGSLSAAIALGFGCWAVLEQRNLGETTWSWLAGMGQVGYLGFWVVLYGFWIWHMGREHRWKWLVLLLMALGLIVIGLIGRGGFLQRAQPVTVFVGMVWIVSGLITLLMYLRHTHSPVAEES